MLQLYKLNLMQGSWKRYVLGIWKKKTLQSITLQSGLCRGNPSIRKILWE